MSDKEIPEPEPSKAPLFVILLFGLMGLFFVGLLVAVFNRDTGIRQEEEEEDEIDPSLKDPLVLLGAEDKFRVRFETSAGPFVVEVRPEWAPRAATQFRELIEAEFFDENRFFRVVPNFIVQFGLNGNPQEQQRWAQPLPDEPVVKSNTKGTITFAKSSMPNSRTTQVFINLKDNSQSLDPQGFAAFGTVVEGMENVEKINAEYGESPDQEGIRSRGNAYLEENFPRLDTITSAKIVE